MLLLFVEVWDHEVCLIGANSAGLSIARQELDRVLAGQESETGVVLDGTVGELGGGCTGDFDVDIIADVADRGTARRGGL